MNDVFISNSDTYVKGSRLVGKVRSVRFLTPEVAVMHAVGGTVMGGQIDIEPDRNSVQTLVAVKLTGGEWRLAAFQNTHAMFIGRPEESQALQKSTRGVVIRIKEKDRARVVSRIEC